MQDIQRVLREAHVAGAMAMKGHQPKDVADTVGSFDHWKNHIAGNQLVIKAEHLLERQVGSFVIENFDYETDEESNTGSSFNTATKLIGDDNHLYEQYLYGLNFIQVIRIYGFTAFLTNNTTTLY